MSFEDASAYIRPRISHALAAIVGDNVTRFTEAIASDSQTQKFVEKIRECESLLENLVNILDDDDSGGYDFSNLYLEEHKKNLLSIIQSYTEALNLWIDHKVWIDVAEFAREEAERIKASGNVSCSVLFTQEIPPPLRRAMENSSRDFALLLGLNASSADAYDARAYHRDGNF